MNDAATRPSSPARLMERTFGALPDALTALYFLSLWLFPLLFGPHAVRNGMLLMLVEFLLLHAAPPLRSILLLPRAVLRRAGRAVGIC